MNKETLRKHREESTMNKETLTEQREEAAMNKRHSESIEEWLL